MPGRIEHTEEAITGIEEARRYAEMHRQHARWIYRAFLNDIRRLTIAGTCLEVGAGPGILAVMMAQAHPHIHITAVDLSADMVAVAGEYIEEKGLAERVRSMVANVNDESVLKSLGTFDMVYSTFSMHHWKAVGDGGILYIHDMKRVWWSALLPLGKGDKESIRASYTPAEIEGSLQTLGIHEYEMRTLFPFFLQSLGRRHCSYCFKESCYVFAYKSVRATRRVART